MVFKNEERTKKYLSTAPTSYSSTKPQNSYL